MTTAITYRIVVVKGFSAYDHLAPTGISGQFTGLTAARKALEDGRKAQGDCESKSRQVRCDIVRNDGKRFVNM